MPIKFNCPHCQATMKVPDEFAGKTGKCPKCGESVIVPPLQPPSMEPSAQPIAPPKEDCAAEEPLPKRKRGRSILIGIGLIVLIVLGIGGFVMWNDAQRMKTFKAWAEAKETNSIDAYQTFLDMYGKSAYASEASELHHDLLWAEVRNGDTKEQYNAYITAYPEGAHAKPAHGRIKEFEKAEQLEREKKVAEEQASSLSDAMTEAKKKKYFNEAISIMEKALAANPHASNRGDGERFLWVLNEGLKEWNQNEALKKAKAEASKNAIAAAKMVMIKYLDAHMNGSDGSQYWARGKASVMEPVFFNVNSYQFAEDEWSEYP